MATQSPFREVAMKVHRYAALILGIGLTATAFLTGCNKPDPDLIAAQTAASELQDSLTYLRGRLSDQSMQASMFVNEINEELAKAKSLSKMPAGELQSTSQIAEINAERNETLKRITQLIEQLRGARGRIAGLRLEVATKDTALATQTLEYEEQLATVNQAAEAQRFALQMVIDEKTAQVSALTKQVDTLTRTIHSAYVVTGTREELVKKGVLVVEGRKKFLVAGERPVVPARTLDPSVFTRIDALTDTTIVLPDGVYKIVSRQDGAFVSPQMVKSGVVSGAFTVGNPSEFWSVSRFLILVKI
jgi:hypothetical protein